MIAGALVLDPLDRRRSRRTSGSRTAGSSGSGGPATARSATGSSCAIGPHTAADHGLRADRHARRHRQPRPSRSARRSSRPRCPAGSRRSSRPASRSRHGRWPSACSGSMAGRSTSGCRPARGSRTTARSEALLDAGACGFKIHEDYGAYPELIDHDAALRRRARRLRRAAHGRPARGGRARGHDRGDRRSNGPRLSRRGQRRRPPARPAGARARGRTSCARRRRRPSRSGSTPRSRASPMIVLNHGASFAVAEDMALVAERVHPATMAAEGPLHELGAIGIVNSDSQGMGRIMETVRRTIQLAHVMRAWRATEAGSGHAGLPDDGDDAFDSTRARAALPGQGHDRAGDHPRDLGPRRLAGARPTGRHRPVEAGLLRGQARVRVQGRAPGLGPARRGATPRSSVASRPATGRTGAGRVARRPVCP